MHPRVGATGGVPVRMPHPDLERDIVLAAPVHLSLGRPPRYPRLGWPRQIQRREEVATSLMLGQ
jgi:hypothetical protein